MLFDTMLFPFELTAPYKTDVHVMYPTVSFDTVMFPVPVL